MTTNPLVAAAADSGPSPWAGVWICEDIELIAQGVRTGSWIDGSLGIVSAGLDALALVSDPAGVLLQYGIAWLIEHVKPLSEALDWLAGDPAEITAHAQTWRNVAASLRDDAAELAHAVRTEVTGWTGAAATGYRRWAAEQQQAVTGLAQGAEVMAAITEGAAGLVAAVRLLVRDAIAACVSRLIVYAAELVATAGLATPLVVEQVTATVASWAGRIGRLLRGLLASLRRLMPEMRRLGDLIEKLKEALGRLTRSDPGRPHVPIDGIHGGHTTRPRNLSDYDRQENWAKDAYEAIRRYDDAEAVARNLADAPRLDGTRGFSPAEVEQIRRHIFFEEHPMDDYAGGTIRQRYDPSAPMAEAWLRLRRGDPLPEDLRLLEHELAESRYYLANPRADYREAHLAANRIANWEDSIPGPTYEDYSRLGE
ncbi:WXG100 family type VII secretion target [Micromonospora aurantiaca]|uniref:WXG100 family type VII secretion target n=1 Tax=Micromonospora aurantiaca (nom. illeg.) TaxID=47850 RepID=A0ABQ6UKM4_9ACTN|nr:WXG100 family type VII secretion target [Micromonospora aurantiaca]KAB1117616.1 WXG100 family type VII secretion target [Micromonospora aurantiaca]UFN97419.1 WXG100 family type VII secretion target [Micromonospora aurantiaca]